MLVTSRKKTWIFKKTKFDFILILSVDWFRFLDGTSLKFSRHMYRNRSDRNNQFFWIIFFFVIVSIVNGQHIQATQNELFIDGYRKQTIFEKNPFCAKPSVTILSGEETKCHQVWLSSYVYFRWKIRHAWQQLYANKFTVFRK